MSLAIASKAGLLYRRIFSRGLQWLLGPGVAVCLIAVTGCSTTYTRKDAEERLPSLNIAAPVTRIPLKVGLYIPSALEGRVASAGPRGAKVHVALGEVVLPYFRWATAQMFAEVVPLSSFTPGDTLIPGIAGVIELVEADGVTYTIKMHEAERDPVVFTISGVPYLGSTLYGAWHYSNIFRDALAQYIVRFSAQAEIREWLARHGIAQNPLVPKFEEAGGANASKERIIVIRNEDDARSCLERPLAAVNRRFEFAPSEPSRSSLFPWFEVSVVPRDDDGLVKYAASPALRRRLQALGIRYLLDFTGNTDNAPNRTLGAGLGGVVTGTRSSNFTVFVFDLWQGRKIFDGGASNSSDYVIVVFIVPMPVLPATEAKTCRELAGSIAGAIEKTRQDNPVMPSVETTQ